MPLSAFKALVREQFYLLLIDGEAALAAIPSMLSAEPETRSTALALIKEVLGARGALDDIGRQRLERIESLFTMPDVPFRRPAAALGQQPLDKAS